MLFPFFHLLHLVPTANKSHVCMKLLEAHFTWFSRNSGTNFNLEGENVTGYRYMIHLSCLAVQAGFYSDVVVCRTLSPADRVRSPVREKCYFYFFTCYMSYIASSHVIIEKKNKTLIRQCFIICCSSSHFFSVPLEDCASWSCNLLGLFTYMSQ